MCGPSTPIQKEIIFLFPIRLYRSTYISGPPVWVPPNPPPGPKTFPPFWNSGPSFDSKSRFIHTPYLGLQSMPKGSSKMVSMVLFWVHPHPLLGPPRACPKVTVQWSLWYFMDEILQVKLWNSFRLVNGHMLTVSYKSIGSSNECFSLADHNDWLRW
jgi:hypothetical protein